jgi:uncharacterized small protein (DUF1192 family)
MTDHIHTMNERDLHRDGYVLITAFHLAALNAQIAELNAEIERLKAERDHWRANHDNQVHLRRILMDRPDLRERSKMIQSLVAENERLKQELSNNFIKANHLD